MPDPNGQTDDQLFLLFVEILDFAKFEEILPRHLAWLTARFAEGSFLVTGGLFDSDGDKSNRALAILRAPSLQAAEALISDDPFTMAGVCKTSFLRYAPRMHAEALGGIFPMPLSNAIARPQMVPQQ